MSDVLKLDFRKMNLTKLNPRSRPPGTSLLGLAFDGGRLEGASLRRTNGSVEVRSTCSASLSLDPLTAAPELVGREIRKHLDAAEIRERRCAVCLPLNWALTVIVKLPDLPEADQQSFLHLEAERGLPYAPDTLMLSQSRFRAPGGDQYALLVAIPRDHVSRLEAVLEAAQLRPVSFSLGISALQRPDAESSNGVIALAPGENNVNVQISLGGGVAVLRTIEGAFEVEGGERRLQVEHVFRELRITLGQLPSDVRESVQSAVKRLRVFGSGDAAEEIAEQLRPRAGSLGVVVELARRYASDEFPVKVPVDAPISPALSLAVRHLAGQPSGFEFLPPKISAWQQFTSRYSSKKLLYAGMATGAILLVAGVAFGVQQAQLWYWGGKWNSMKTRVHQLDDMQANIKKYRPWYDETYRSLSILREVTKAFTEDGTVSAKRIEIRDPSTPGDLPTVTCTGTARSNQALLQTTEKLSATKGVKRVHRDVTKGTSPMQFTFTFNWDEQATR